MKKLAIVIFAVTVCMGLSLTAHAQNELYEVSEPAAANEQQVAQPATATERQLTDEELLNAQRMEDAANKLRLADGAAGKGTIDDIAAYWTKNGWPDNISFACHVGGETLPYNPDADNLPNAETVIAWWEIGIINANEAARQEILALMSPECRVTFRDCTWSYKQREAAFNEITASRDDIVRDAMMSLNTEVVVVEIGDGYEKEYAKKFIDQYGAFVVVTNDAAAANDAAPAEGMVPELGGVLEMGGELDKGGAANNPFGAWFWVICLVFLTGIAMLAYFNRARLVPALQTANGSVVTGGVRISRRQTEAAVKDSALSPPGDAFKSIMERVDDPQE
jgi:hypothetical protein